MDGNTFKARSQGLSEVLQHPENPTCLGELDSGIISPVDRLYTCFVSSTFLDLRAERERLSSVLLRHQCVPLGMEFFPSMGRRQWELIEESVLAADFCILWLVAATALSARTRPFLGHTASSA